jgi:membrane dipeptidase
MSNINYLFSFAVIIILSGGAMAERDYHTEAYKIHNEIFNIDTHNDTPMLMQNKDWNIAEEHSVNDIKISRFDLPRMKKGGLDGAFFAAFVAQTERTEEKYKIAQQEADNMIKAVKDVCKANPSVIRAATAPEEAFSNREKNLLTAYIGLENGFPVALDITNIKKYYDMGVRYITLCHTKNNDICDSSNDTPEHNGLSEFGKKVIKRMNELGMIIDVSHISDKAFYDVIELSRVPVVASHSSARAVCDNPRNMTDEMLLKLKENGGVIQMCILSEHIKTPPKNPQRENDLAALEKKYGKFNEITDRAILDKYYAEWDAKYPGDLATVKDFVDHIDHVVNLIGIDYVGIGTDFDGGGGLRDCKDVSELPNITAELLRRGYNKDDLKKIWGDNFMRVFRQVVKAAK